MRHFSVLTAVVIVTVLAFSVRLTGLYTDVRDASRQTALVSEGAVQRQAVIAGMSEKKSLRFQPPHAQAAKPVSVGDVSPPADDVLGMGQGATQDRGRADVSSSSSGVWRGPIEQDFDFETTRLDYADRLDKRRQALDGRAKDLQAQEALLKAARQEMDRKYAELSLIRGQIETLLEEQGAQERAQIMSLVKIYEAMKAKDAAVIFNTLDVGIVKRVMMNMSERKASAILAKMDPERAKTLTVILAEEKSLTPALAEY